MEERRQYQHKPMSREEGKDALIAEAYKVMQEDEGLLCVLCKFDKDLIELVKDKITYILVNSNTLDHERFCDEKSYRSYLYKINIAEVLSENLKRKKIPQKSITLTGEPEIGVSQSIDQIEKKYLYGPAIDKLKKDIISTDDARVTDVLKEKLIQIIDLFLFGHNISQVAKEMKTKRQNLEYILKRAKELFPHYTEVWNIFKQSSNGEKGILQEERDKETLVMIKLSLKEKETQFDNTEKKLYALLCWFTEDDFSKSEVIKIFSENGTKKITEGVINYYLSAIEALAGRSLTFPVTSILYKTK